MCTLKCAGCARTKFIDQWPQHWRNHNLNITALMQFLDIDLNGLSVEFCGDYGDPIYHPEFIEMVGAVKQRGARVVITTNGSYHRADWWQSLCQCLDSGDVIRFSIDGMPDNFTQYRKNADWESIKVGIEVCRTHAVQMFWKFIPFAYNYHQIDQAQQMAANLDMGFIVDVSDRFDDATMHLEPPAEFLRSRSQAQQQVKQGQQQTVSPKCDNGKMHYISASGHFVPCCYLADHRFYYKTEFGKNKQVYQIDQTTFAQVMNQPKVIGFYQSIDTSPHIACQYNCPGTGKLDL
jgi:pyruvate-formate lyase-activating enzyme